MAGGSTATVKHLATKWDPLDSSDWDKEKPTAVCTTRIQRYIEDFEYELCLASYQLIIPLHHIKQQRLLYLELIM